MRPTPFTAVRSVAVAAGTLAGLLCASSAHAANELVLVPEHPIYVAYLIAGFLLLIPVVDRLIVRPVFRVIDERAEKIEGARDRAAKLQLDADSVLSKYETAVHDVREEAERGRRDSIDAARAQQAEVTGAARAEAEREIEESRTELESSLADARASLRGTAESLAKQAAEQVLGRTI
ncbi:MAG: ATP synthase F0 subunit B [Myxococcota bacterium]|nr:ATP synthase F0 subunit B [Myxococcota bacterium]